MISKMRIINNILLVGLYVVTIFMSSLQEYLFMDKLVICGFIIFCTCFFTSLEEKEKPKSIRVFSNNRNQKTN